MNLPDFQHLFTSSSMKKALEYINDIDWVSQSDGQINAIVQGSNLYHVEILWDQDEFIKLECSCPYDYDGYCKHIAAVLLDGQGIPTSKSSKKRKTKTPKKIPMIDILNENSKQDIIHFVQHIQSIFPTTEEHVRLFFQTSKPESNVSQVELLFQKHTDNSGIIKWKSRHKIVDQLYTLIQKSLTKDDYMSLIKVGTKIIHELNHQLAYVDDSDGVLSSMIDMIFIYFEELVSEEKLNETQRAQFVQELFLLLEKENIYNFDVGIDTWQLLSLLIKTENELNQFFDYLKAKTTYVDDYSSNFYTEQALVLKLHMLDKFGRKDNYDKLVQSNLHYPEIRKRMVDDAKLNKNFTKAKELIKEGISQAQQDGHPGTLASWETELLNVLIQDNDSDAIEKQVLRNFYANHFSIENYELVKKYTSEKAWPEIQKEIFMRMKHPNERMIIFSLEKMYDELFNTIEKDGFEFYDTNQYFEELKTHDEKRLTELLETRIKEFMAENTGRPKYKLVAKQLKKMSKINQDAKLKVSEIAEFLRNKYPSRYALKDELVGF